MKGSTKIRAGLLAVLSVTVGVHSATGWWPADDLVAWSGMPLIAARCLAVGTGIAVISLLYCCVVVLVRKLHDWSDPSPIAPGPPIIVVDGPSETELAVAYSLSFAWLLGVVRTTLTEILRERFKAGRARRHHRIRLRAVRKAAEERCSKLEAAALAFTDEPWSICAQGFGTALSDLADAISSLQWRLDSEGAMFEAAGRLERLRRRIEGHHRRLQPLAGAPGAEEDTGDDDHELDADAGDDS